MTTPSCQMADLSFYRHVLLFQFDKYITIKINVDHLEDRVTTAELW